MGLERMADGLSRRPVVIIGAGLGGLVTAVALQRVGLTPLVFEKKQHVQRRKSGVALWASAIRVLDRLGVGPKLRSHGLPTLEGQITDSGDGRVLFHFNLAQQTRGLISEIIVTERSDLRQILLEELSAESVVFNMEMDNFVQHDDRVDVKFTNGDHVEAAVLVGADGLQSKVRARMGIQSSLKYAGYSTWRAVTETGAFGGELPFELGREIWGPGKRFGTMHISPGRIYWYAIANARQGEVFVRPFREKLLKRFGDWPYQCRELIESTNEQNVVRYDVQHRSMAFPWVNGRVALIGDAAHPITPNMHQGNCIAIEDGYCLAQMLAEYGVRDPTALEMFENTRRQRTLDVAQRSWKIGRFAQWEHPVACWFRRRLLGHSAATTSLYRTLKMIGDYDAGDLPGPFLRG